MTNHTLVICEDQSIHRAGCKDSEKRGMNPGEFATDFSGSTLKQLSEWWATNWNEDTNEDTTAGQWLQVLVEDVKGCTGLR